MKHAEKVTPVAEVAGRFTADDGPPGFMRTERVVEAFRRAGAPDAINGPGGPRETTAYLGRAIVALASDAEVIENGPAA